MNRTLKEATVKVYYYDTPDILQMHVDDYLRAYNFGKRLKRLKSLKFKTPFEMIVETWKTTPQVFAHDPNHLLRGLNTLARFRHYMLENVYIKKSNNQFPS